MPSGSGGPIYAKVLVGYPSATDEFVIVSV
jgi:hypothetical protein